jgi:hypothetical protein
LHQRDDDELDPREGGVDPTHVMRSWICRLERVGKRPVLNA